MTVRYCRELSSANTAIYERVEVVRGATGLMSGAGDPSAAINLVRQFQTQWSLQLNLNNALDEKYRSGSYWWGSPLTYAELREWLLTMDYEF
ncbi:MAG TPA: hypothetical protein VGA18_04115 [Rhodothermales bacterium]|jgi:outer membrane receptor for ferric coprogen and ferric-rhodotorulic acid